MKSIKDIAKFVESRGEKITPLTLQELETFYNKFGSLFPSVYKDFLSIMGNGAGSYMQGSSVFYDEIYSLRKWTLDLISEYHLGPLHDDAFVFWMHQGYQAAYFRLDGNQDPLIYYFTEGQKERCFQKTQHSLTQFFLLQLTLETPGLETAEIL